MQEFENTSGTMNCGVVSELLESFHAGKLNTSAEQSVKEHLEGCAACSVRLASIQRKSQAAVEGVSGDAGSAYAAASAADGDSGAARRHWWNGIPRLALLAIGLAVVVVPGSFWLARHRGQQDRVFIPDARMPAVAALRRMGDDETKSVQFALSRPVELQVYAVGEGMDGEMYDYGWIVDADSRGTVWEMEYSATDPAGGADKNRMAKDVVALDPGEYVLHYRTDDSHSFEDWNSEPPDDEESWGIALSVIDASDMRFVELARPIPPRSPRAPRSEREEIADAVANATAAAMEVARVAAAEAVRGVNAEVHREMNRIWDEVEVVAQLVRVGDDADLRERFTLDRDSQVRIYALGEATFGDMHDYAWIEDVSTGRTVWRMSYDQTEHAGGADKNRVADTVVRLGAGEYVLRYQSDDSHAFDTWNLEAPPDAANYGVTLFREGR